MNQFEEQLFYFKAINRNEKREYEKNLPDDYVAVDIKTASLVGIIMWWIRNGLHFSSDYIANQIYLMYKG